MRKLGTIIILCLLSDSVVSNTIQPVPESVQTLMRKYTWHKGCPVSIEDLSYLELKYWGYDNQPHLGYLIVHKTLAKETEEIFNTLYQHHFPIQKIDLIEHYKGDDLTVMKKNVTTAFNCRAITGKPGTFSQHSYGRAIDINPLINPYIKGNKVLPIEGIKYLDRKKDFKGKITKDSLLYQQFTNYGWDWGGNWTDLQDYQHFEKRANRKKRTSCR